jgi:hypothetical protein
MANVNIQLIPETAQFLAANFPQFTKVNGSNFPVSGLAFDASVDEAAFWRFIAKNYASGNLSIEIFWYAASASSGNVVWEAQISAITPDTDTQDIETDGLATLNFVQDTHLGTTGKRLHKATITLSNLDSLADGDVVTLRIARDANGTSGTDDMTGDAIIVAVNVSYLST